MSAVLRVVGERHLLISVVAECVLPFSESAQSRRNRRLNADTRETETTYNLTVSHADGNEVPVQVREVDAFLDANENLLANLIRSIPGCRCTIDFSWDFPTTSVLQYNWFPAALLARLGVLGVDLMVSVYSTSQNVTTHPAQPSSEPKCSEVVDLRSPQTDR